MKAEHWLLCGLALAVGFAWGFATREAASDATDVTWRDGELLVRVRAAQALREGLVGALSG